MDVASELGGWSTFFAAFAEASAALLGLLFVAVSLLSGGWRRSERLSLVINQSGIELLYPLLASLLMLVPAGVPIVHGIGLLVLAGTALVTSIRRFRHGTAPSRTLTDSVGAIGVVLYALSGVALLQDARIGIYGVALASFLMIVAGTVNTWTMLVGAQNGDE